MNPGAFADTCACPAAPVHYQHDPVQTTKTSVHGAIVLAVAHAEFKAMGNRGLDFLSNLDSVVFDVKAALPAGTYDGRL